MHMFEVRSGDYVNLSQLVSIAALPGRPGESFLHFSNGVGFELDKANTDRALSILGATFSK